MNFHPIERPTEPGWYWYREHMIVMGELEPFEVIRVFDNDGLWFERDMKIMPIKYLDGQFYGPSIQEPNVAGKPSSFENGTYH